MLIEKYPFIEPECICAAIADEQGTILLESAMQHDVYGRYSFIALDPFKIITSKHGIIQDGSNFFASDIFSYLKKVQAEYRLDSVPGVPPFIGGLAGFWSYDIKDQLENLTSRHDATCLPEVYLGCYDLVVAFEHDTCSMWLCSSGFPHKEANARNKRASERLNWLQRKLRYIKQKIVAVPDLENIQVTSNFSKIEYCNAVAKVQKHILEGDIFQANISQCFTAELPQTLSPFELYSKLKRCNPAPFASFINAGENKIISSSPERFVKSNVGKEVETRPIKGTIAASSNPEKDTISLKTLLESAKDRAENIMIVDLMRNDLSRVCNANSIIVSQLCEVETFSSIHHLVSVVRAKLQPKHTVLDLLTATLPGGSITGAPKIRAMQIIDAVERCRRGIYCGTIGYISFTGAMDTAIAIRTLWQNASTLKFQAGGAVVLDSKPESEYCETLVKAAPILRALNAKMKNSAL